MSVRSVCLGWHWYPYVYSKTADDSDGAPVKALSSEIVALRTILLNVIYKQANGESLTAEEMQRLIERADADKLKKAADRLQQGSKSSST